MIDILYIQNSEPLSDIWTEQIFTLITDKERVKAFNYRRWQDRQAFLMGRFLLAELLKKSGHSTTLLKTVQQNEFNRPSIPGENFDFNISHSGEYVICAFSPHQKLGIDIEQIQPVNIGDFKSILNASDRQNIATSANRHASFFRIWSAKEAVLKAHGCGLVDDIHNLGVNKQNGIFNNTKYYIKDLPIHPNYSCCIASARPLKGLQIEKISLKLY